MNYEIEDLAFETTFEVEVYRKNESKPFDGLSNWGTLSETVDAVGMCFEEMDGSDEMSAVIYGTIVTNNGNDLNLPLVYMPTLAHYDYEYLASDAVLELFAENKED